MRFTPLFTAPGPLPVLAALLLAALCFAEPVSAKLSVFDSPHNLSARGGRGRSSGEPGVTFSEEQQVCVFCHVPHHAKSGGPLWSRDLSPESTVYEPYNESSTLQASPKPDRPTGASRLCLSCHDGTIALAKYVGSRITDERKISADPDPGYNTNLGTDLRDDHPISFLYTDALAQKSALVSPADLPGRVRLEKGVALECTACHDPHDNQYGNFLVINNGDPDKPDYQPGSPLCATCHLPAEWSRSSHNQPALPELSKGCMHCHMVHNAPGPIRLLRFAALEDNCLASCHNDSTQSSQNMEPLFRETMHRHPVEYHPPDPTLDHDARETLPAQNYHVQCVDCHNPHQANGEGGALSNPPLINGALKGVRSDPLGTLAATEYGICFKCHSGARSSEFYGKSEQMPNRAIAEPDQQKRFDGDNPSFHPVTAPRRGNGASLLADLQPDMRLIYCSDCHGSDQSAKALGGAGGPNGPHGSQYPHILLARYEMPLSVESREPYNSALYALCFRCHSLDYVMSEGGGTAFVGLGTNLHLMHVRDREIPCFACHDPHGVPLERGATFENNAHLINFDLGYASGTQVANPLYVTDGSGGSCTVNCHTNSGHTREYGAGLPRRLMNLPRPAPVRWPGQLR